MKDILKLSTLCLITILGIYLISELPEMYKSHTVERHYHYLLPKHAQCAVKEMYFKTDNGEMLKSTRQVCHWEHQ